MWLVGGCGMLGVCVMAGWGTGHMAMLCGRVSRVKFRCQVGARVRSGNYAWRGCQVAWPGWAAVTHVFLIPK